MSKEDNIQKGFNAGYQLQKHDPNLAESLANSFVDKEHPYAEGFSKGAEQYTVEQAQSKSSYKDRLKGKLQSKSSTKAKGKDDLGL